MEASGAGENMFKGINVDTDMLNKQLPDFDSRSCITSKSLKGLHMKKKEKQKVKHQLWMKSRTIILLTNNAMNILFCRSLKTRFDSLNSHQVPEMLGQYVHFLLISMYM